MMKQRSHWYELRSEREYGCLFLDGVSRKSSLAEAIEGAAAKQWDWDERGIDEKVVLVQVRQSVTAIEL